MKENEKEFLAQVALGWFNVSTENGMIMRMARMFGSRIGNKSHVRMLENPVRAERSISRNHLKIWFTTEEKRMAVYSHRIIWMIANNATIPDGLEINHKDGNPKNNRAENLEVVTRQENTLHAGRVLKVMGKKNQTGERNAYARVNEEQVLKIRKLCKMKTMPQHQIAKLFGIEQVTVSNIHRRKTWKHLPE
ncbi:MAG: HNH endonuclease signature motif containing protein [Clostridia bacterium]